MARMLHPRGKSGHRQAGIDSDKKHRELSSEGKSKGSSPNTAVITAVIGGIVTVVVALIGILPQLLKNPSNSMNVNPTSALAASTQIQVTATPTLTVTPQSSPITAQTRVVTVTSIPTIGIPSLNCLDGWQVISSNPDIQPTPEALGECGFASLPPLGISTANDELLFGLSNFKNTGVFGVSTSIPVNASFHLKVEETVLFQAEFWIGISNDAIPGSNMMVISLEPANGEIRLYVNQTSSATWRYTWTGLAGGLSAPPYVYEMRFSIAGNRINARINDTYLPSESVNTPKYLFIGFRNKSKLGSVSMQVEISDLTKISGE